MNRRDTLKALGNVLGWLGLAAGPLTAVTIHDYLLAPDTPWVKRAARRPIRISALMDSPYYGADLLPHVDVYYNGLQTQVAGMHIQEACEGDATTGWVHQLISPNDANANALLDVVRTSGGDYGCDGHTWWVKRSGCVEIRIRDHARLSTV